MDWNSPAGFNRVLIPRYIDWRFEVAFEDEPDSILHVHDIGSRTWFQKQNKSIEFYMETDFSTYFSNEKEVIQAHSFDFTYALLRNKHLRKKARELGLHTVKCKVCCIWNYLFRHSTSFVKNSATVARKLGLTPQRDLIFVDFSYPFDSISQNLLMRQMKLVFSCIERVAQVFHDPVCVVASNSYYVLSQVETLYPMAKTNGGLFFTRARYQNELSHQHNGTGHGLPSVPSNIIVPKTEHNALMHYFMGYYLQLNSTVLFTSRKSLFSETMAAFRHYHRPSETYITHPDIKCQLERYR